MQQALYCRAEGADKFKQVLQAGLRPSESI